MFISTPLRLAALLSFDNHFPQPNSRFQPKSDDWR
jgi:hypothetical protein